MQQRVAPDRVPAGFGDWIGLFREDGNAAAGEWWSEESQVWQAAVADKATHGLIASNLSAPDKFVLPQGGPWRLAYFDGACELACELVCVLV